MKANNLVFVTDHADVEAVGTGFTKQPAVVRKGRARKKTDSPRAALAVKKRKAPKPPRNPLRRSETSKLHLKNLQMGKRVETMTPRVEFLRKRIDVMQTRLDFAVGRLKLVKEEPCARFDASTLPAGGGTAVAPTEYADTQRDNEEEDENIELDDEVEDGVDVLQAPALP